MPLTSKGFKPSKSIILQRLVARIIIFLFRINGKTRWGNEFIQCIDQTVLIHNPLDPHKTLTLKTGHGRLFWRSVEALQLEPETNNLLKTLMHDEVFYDIGSNIGVYSLLAAQHRQVRTYSFEMELMNCSVQHENIHMNNLQNLITLVPVALSDKNSIRKVFFKDISPGDALHSLDNPSPTLDIKRRNQTISSSLLTFSLDELIENFSLPKPNVIKLDVVGIELAILRGAINCLDSARAIMVEVDKHNESEIIELLSGKGFNHMTNYNSHNYSSSNRNILFSKTL